MAATTRSATIWRNMKRDGSWRSIRVKVNAPGVHVHFRNGYYAPRDFQHLQKEDRQQQLVEAMGSENPVVELPIAVETSMFRLSNGRPTFRSPPRFHLPHSIGPKARTARSRVRLCSASPRVSHRARSSPNSRTRFKFISTRRDSSRSTSAVLSIRAASCLSPGTYHLKFLARENESGRIGTFEQDFSCRRADGSHLLSSVLLSSQLVPVDKSSEVETQAKGVRAKLTDRRSKCPARKSSPASHVISRKGKRSTFSSRLTIRKNPTKPPSSTPNTSRRSDFLQERNSGQRNAAAHARAGGPKIPHRIISYQPAPRETSSRALHAQALVIAAGTQHSAFGRAYLAIERPPAAPSIAPAPLAPDAAPQPKPPSP